MVLLKIATIGTSQITEAFIAAAKKSGSFELHTVYSRNIEKAEQFRQKNGAQHAADNLSELAAPDIDAVYIASPNSVHFEQAEYFLKKGKHCICEKPIVTKKGQLSRLFETARQNGVFLFEALRHIYTPGFIKVKQSINEIAPVRSVYLSYNQYSSKYDAFKRGEIASSFNSELDGGALFDLGVYPVSFAAALFGKPEKISHSQHYLSNGVCGLGAFILEYNGFLCNISYSKIADDIIENQIIGENGGIRFKRQEYIDCVSLRKRGGQAEDFKTEHDENLLFYEAVAFAEIIEKRDVERYKELAEISMITSEILTSY